MRPTGIIRRIDDLGRIVIPKEIRRSLEIKECDPMEIFLDDAGRIILQKYEDDEEECFEPGRPVINMFELNP